MMQLFGPSLLVVVGAWLAYQGERDDSPGLGGIGVILALVGLWLVWRELRRRGS